MTVAALATDETLLILKIAFLVLLYGFIVLVIRSATKGMDQAPQESIILGAAEAAALRAEHGLPATRLLVVSSPELQEGVTQTEDAVRSWLRARVAGYKVPKLVVFQRGLPREDSGKIFKRKLRAPYWEKAGRRI